MLLSTHVVDMQQGHGLIKPLVRTDKLWFLCISIAGWICLHCMLCRRWKGHPCQVQYRDNIYYTVIQLMVHLSSCWYILLYQHLHPDHSPLNFLFTIYCLYNYLYMYMHVGACSDVNVAVLSSCTHCNIA